MADFQQIHQIHIFFSLDLGGHQSLLINFLNKHHFYRLLYWFRLTFLYMLDRNSLFYLGSD